MNQTITITLMSYIAISMCTIPLASIIIAIIIRVVIARIRTHQIILFMLSIPIIVASMWVADALKGIVWVSQTK